MLISLLFQQPLLFVAFALAMVLALSFHEFSHAYVASRLGDPTAEQEGRLTLNPLAHLDPIGTLLLLVIGFGWGKPVPYDPHRLRMKKLGPVLVGLAGPISNILMAILGSLVWFVIVRTPIGMSEPVQAFFQIFVFINIGLALFNIIPVPPLDGSKILTALLTPKYLGLAQTIERIGPFILLAVVILDRFGLPLLTWISQFSISAATKLLSI